MNSFFDLLPLEAAEQIEQLSRLMYELRENRTRLLAPYQVEDEAELIDAICRGRVAEHPAYEHYLGARTLEATREDVRVRLQALLSELEG